MKWEVTVKQNTGINVISNVLYENGQFEGLENLRSAFKTDAEWVMFQAQLLCVPSGSLISKCPVEWKSM